MCSSRFVSLGVGGNFRLAIKFRELINKSAMETGSSDATKQSRLSRLMLGNPAPTSNNVGVMRVAQRPPPSQPNGEGPL